MIPLVPQTSEQVDPKGKIEEMVGEADDVVVLSVTSPINYFPLFVNTLVSLLETEGAGLCITFNRSSEALENILKKHDIETGRLHFVDCISKVSGIDVKDERNEYADSPSALSSISMAITEKLGKMKGRRFIIFDSITTLLVYNSIANVLQFMDYIINKLRSEQVKTVIFAVEESDQKLINHLMQSCDRIYRF